MNTVPNVTEIAQTFQWRPFLRQLLASSTTWVTYFMFGLSLGTPTVTIPQLRMEANSTAVINDEMVSWLSAASGYVAMLCMIILGLIAHNFGRQKSILLVGINSCAAFAILYLSRHAMDVLISQILQGMTHAATTTISLLVVSECTAPKYRGIFLTIKSATAFWGIWTANAIGAFFSYRNIGLFGIVCSVYSIIFSFIVPESPYWLASKERYDECALAHRWLKGKDTDMEKELQILINDQKDLKTWKKQQKSAVPFKVIRNMLKPEFYKPISISLLVTAMYFYSGKLVCTIYSIQMIKKITGSEATAYVGMLVLDGFTVLGMYIGCGLSKILKRRTLLLSASTIGTIFLYVMSGYLYLAKHSFITENHYVSIALLTGYSIAVCCGPLILATSIYAELIPVRSRNFSICIIAYFSVFTLASLLKISPYMFNHFGFHGTFLFFAITSTIIIVLVYKYLPEIKDMTLIEIANLFKSNDRNIEPKELLLNKNSSGC